MKYSFFKKDKECVDSILPFHSQKRLFLEREREEENVEWNDEHTHIHETKRNAVHSQCNMGRNIRGGAVSPDRKIVVVDAAAALFLPVVLCLLVCGCMYRCPSIYR